MHIYVYVFIIDFEGKKYRKDNSFERTNMSYILTGIYSEMPINRPAFRYLLLYNSLFAEYIF